MYLLDVLLNELITNKELGLESIKPIKKNAVEDEIT